MSQRQASCFANMTELVANVFRFSNPRGYFVPELNIHYEEKSTGQVWQINCAGTRGYFLRFGMESPIKDDINEQAADSHFMAQRVTSALLIGGAGLFEADPAGRIFFKGMGEEITWSGHLDRPDPFAGPQHEKTKGVVLDWYRALCEHTVLRRALNDAYLAILHPHEALIFVYRGLEWLKLAQNLSWEDIAKDLGVPVKELKEFTKYANHETGVRHATLSGRKVRADLDTYGSWVCGLLDEINATRARFDKSFTPMTPNEVGDTVARAVQPAPYP